MRLVDFLIGILGKCNLLRIDDSSIVESNSELFDELRPSRSSGRKGRGFMKNS